MSPQQVWELGKIVIISIIAGVMLTDTLQCIKYYLVSKGRWWKKYPYQNTADNKYTTKNETDESLDISHIHHSQPTHQQNTDSKNKTNTYPDSLLVILRTVTLSGMLVSFLHTHIIKRRSTISKQNRIIWVQSMALPRLDGKEAAE